MYKKLEEKIGLKFKLVSFYKNSAELIFSNYNQKIICYLEVKQSIYAETEIKS